MGPRGAAPRVGTVVAVVVIVVVAAMVVAPSLLGAQPGSARACGDHGLGAERPVALSDPVAGVAELRYTLVDRSRPTPAIAGRPPSPCRVLTTLVRVPESVTGPAPTLLVVHGRDGDPAALAPLLDAWARAGYVVVAPHFLVTQKAANGKALGREVAEQAADARFVLDRITALSRSRGGPLHARVDAGEVGVAGMSLGGQTVYGLISHPCCRDARVRAAVLMAGVHDPLPDADYGQNDAAVLLVQGDADVGYHHSRDTYPDLAPPKWFVTLHDERHSPPFETPRDASSVIVDAATLAFWDLTLRHDGAAAERIGAAVRASHGAATLEADPA